MKKEEGVGLCRDETVWKQGMVQLMVVTLSQGVDPEIPKARVQ